VVSSSSFWERSIFELWKNMRQLDLIRVYIIVIMLACFFILLMHVSLLKRMWRNMSFIFIYIMARLHVTSK
jgi:hypothetical protein